MTKLLRNALLTYFCVFLCVYSAAQCFADPTLDETKKLLQKSLTIVQLDQEIARLSDQDVKVSAQIDDTQLKLVQQDTQVVSAREHAGKVLRAYYMGDRASIWTLIFSAKSFSDALDMYEYLDRIVANDHTSLEAYVASYKQLQDLQKQLATIQTDLREVKAAFITQRDHNIALQKEVDDQLKQIPQDQAQIILAKIEELKATFKEKVVPLFEKYFKGIAEAMPQLVELVQGKEQAKYMNGLSFQISDQDLTQFFRSKNPELFNHLEFKFQNGQYSVVGQDGDIKASIKGHYIVEENPNRLQFHVDDLGYNDNALDETTKRYMEERFNLSFSVEDHMPAFQAKEVTTDNGLLIIKLKLTPKKN
ncbi:MAG: hypothetical protein JWM44_354 [Bacilli bacterium]|nr:hypothetical protein [Bacilli bacterium]